MRVSFIASRNCAGLVVIEELELLLSVARLCRDPFGHLLQQQFHLQRGGESRLVRDVLIFDLRLCSR